MLSFPEATGNWSGWLDGRPEPLLPINAGLLGVRVPAGRHRVGVRYFSNRVVLGYRVAFVTALLVVLGLAGTAAASRVRTLLARLLAGAILLGVLGVAVSTYRSWEEAFALRAGRETVLNHDYPVRLRDQLARWRDRGE